MIIATLKTSSERTRDYKLEENQQYIVGRYPYLDSKEDKGHRINEFKIYSLPDADSTVSRNHFEIVTDDKGNVKIIDNISRNGTYLQRSNNPIVMIKKFEEIKVFDNDIIILGGLGYKLKIEYDKIKCKSCKKEIPVVSLYCSFCGTECNYKNGFYDDSDDSIHVEEQDENAFSDYGDGLTKILEKNIDNIYNRSKQENKNKRQKKEVKEIECINCSNSYLDTQPFCMYCGYQNCNKRVYLSCINEECQIQFRDKFAKCPNPDCSTHNPQSRQETKNGRPPHNMCKEDKEAYLDSGNNSIILDILVDKYETPAVSKIVENSKSKQEAIYQQIRLRGLNRVQIRDKLLKNNGIDLELNGIKHICDNLWNMGLISDVYIGGSDPNKVSEDNRARVFYIITSDKDRFKKKLDEEEQSLDEKLKKMKEKRRKWKI